MRRLTNHIAAERGGAVIEFALSCVVIMPLLLGTIGIGIALVRDIEVTQVCRDSGHLYANGIDFSQPNNQTLITNKIGHDLGLGTTATNSAVILTTITYITHNECSAGNVTDSSCTNIGHAVMTQQIQIGGLGVIYSRFGTPPNPDTHGNVSQHDYLTDARNQAKLLPSSISGLSSFQNGGQFVYASEVTVVNHSLDWTGFIGNTTKALSVF